ncbi:serine/threonine protein kinase [Phormidium sp. CLA17]|uniref:serine/threonine-protein kinase n=1 Tax=Leptolyngbya sp. Cla-17 TaxID=2803751 RepID=UPI001490F3B4|nr:serine/threonine-protein kinase [Leptolyngbya sp. Cla-17]MBM0742871.1 serine/threonine protein kinase [Leptolyngbya sp. Cla-17]
MRPSLPVGTILQNRYRILSILGQGGFGRTYLAEDQGRFNEHCALKELTPAQGGDYALDKSKELFQREAQILYQIQHPQIPQFRATFEQDQRLFLVQDYVEGQTYRALLDQRKSQGIAFSEGEVVQFMRQLLPVMAHIHTKGVIHRDIAPDNVILRQQDSKPVLIDFGVVKELATRFQTMTTGVVQATAVGKPGYAPIEQMQTGKAYPSSDLYSLAVTAVVLLSGREPQELFDDSTMTWYWQRWVTVNPGFAQVLNRMLSYRPGDRYQSVSEVVQALQAAFNPVAPVQQPLVQVPMQPPPPAPPQAVYPAEAPVSLTSQPPPAQSHMRTMAVGQRQQPESMPDPRRSQPIIEEPRSSLWDDPLAIIALGIGLVVLTGLGSWLIMQTILKNQDSSNPLPTPIVTPTFTPTPTITPTLIPTPTPIVTPTPQLPDPVNYTKRLTIDPDTTVTQQGVLKSNETITYIVSGSQDQTLETVISGEGVLMSIIGPDGRVVDSRAQRVSYWQGSLPFNGDYFVELSPVKGVNNGRYDLNVTLRSASRPDPVPTPTPTPTPSPSPNPEPRINEIPVEFPPGDTSQSFSDRTRRNVINRYVTSAPQGSQLTAQMYGGTTLRVYNSAGQVVSSDGATYWQAIIDYDGQYKPGVYRIDALGAKGENYTLDLSLVNR